MKRQNIFTSAGLRQLCAAMARAAKACVDDGVAQQMVNHAAEKRKDIKDNDVGAAPLSFDIEAAQALIIQALDEYDPQLASRAQDVFDEPYRLKLKYVRNGEMRQMHCIPKGMNENKGPAYIEMDFDRSMDAVIILAHELGHALADDIGHEVGHDFYQNPMHMHETQAYAVQHIVSQFLQNHPDAQIAHAATVQFGKGTAAMDAIAKASLVADEALQKQDSGEVFHTALLMDDHFGAGWEAKMYDHQNMHCARVMTNLFEQCEVLNDVKDDQIGAKAREKLMAIKEGAFDRPASFYAALAVVKHGAALQGKGNSVSSPVSLVLGSEGPQGLRAILQSQDMTDENDLISHLHQSKSNTNNGAAAGKSCPKNAVHHRCS